MSAQPAGWAVPSPVLPTCVLCGHQGPDVRHGLIRWRDGDPFGSGPRCQDHGGCHDRVMAQGEEWPVADGRPRGGVPRGTVAPSAPMPEPSTIGELDFGVAPVVPA